MAKFLRKSLIVTLSSLCALSTSIDVKVSGASKAQEKLDQKLSDQIPGFDEKKEAYVKKNTTWVVGNFKDYLVDGSVTIFSLLAGGYFGSKMTPSNPMIGGAGGVMVNGTFIIPYALRNFARRWKEAENAGAQFILNTLVRSSQEAKRKKVMDMAKDSATGSYSIL